MAEGKRYYWLKLYDDFFTSKRIKKLRKVAGGDTYTIIYLKMQLKAIKNNGYLEFTGIEENFADELALDIDEDPDDVKITVTFLLSCGLLETSDNVEFFLPYAIENTGSENASAQRVRDYRKKQKALQCNTDETDVKRIGNVEIETRDRDREREEIDTRDKSKKQEKDTRITKATAFEAFADDDTELLTALKEFEGMRKKIKKPLTKGAIDRLINKLTNQFAREEWIPVLNQSTDHCWQDIYPIKQQQSIGSDPNLGRTAQMLESSNKMMEAWANEHR